MTSDNNKIVQAVNCLTFVCFAAFQKVNKLGLYNNQKSFESTSFTQATWWSLNSPNTKANNFLPAERTWCTAPSNSSILCRKHAAGWIFKHIRRCVSLYQWNILCLGPGIPSASHLQCQGSSSWVFDGVLKSAIFPSVKCACTKEVACSIVKECHWMSLFEVMVYLLINERQTDCFDKNFRTSSQAANKLSGNRMKVNDAFLLTLIELMC